MLFDVVWNSLTGYVIIHVEGLSLERFLNLATEHKIRVWGVRREKYTLLRASVSAGGYKKLLKLSEDRYSLQPIRKKGLPFLLSDAKKRFMLTAGLILIAAAVLALSSFVWEVKLTGLDDAKTSVFMAEIRESGAAPGAFKGNLDLPALERQIAKDHPEIAWVNMEFQGVVLKIQVVEAKLPPEMVDNEGMADIIARKDALVKSVTVLDGKAAVKEGQTVRRGQKLIAGEVWEEGKPRMSFHARGSIIGNVWYLGEAQTRLYDTLRKPTGRTADLRYIQIGNNLVLMGGTDAGFAQYDSVVNVKYALGENLYFPVRVLDVRQAEIKEQLIMRDISGAKAAAEEEAYRKALSAVPEDAIITGSETTFVVTGDAIQAKCYIKTEEEIGMTVKTG